MSVVSEIKEVGPCKKQLSVAVPAPAVEAEVGRVVQTFRRHAKAPGFRKGKMPESMVRQRYKEDIEKEVLDRLIPRYWNQAQAEESLDPLLPPRVEEVDFQPDDQLSFVATVEVRPEIDLKHVDDIDLPESDVEPEDEEIEEALTRLRRNAGEWIEVDRAVGEGDLVEAEVTEGDSDAQEVAFEVGHDQVWPELTDAVTGLSADETATFERSAAEGEEESRKFSVRVGKVKELEMAELDDDLASKLGNFADVAALRSEVEQSIRSSKQVERRRLRERAILDELRARHPFELPEGVIEMEVEGLLREYADGLATRGVDVQTAEVDWQGLAERIKPQAEDRVQSRLILDAIAGSKEVEVESEEIERSLAGIARAQNTSTVSVRRAMDESGQLDNLRMQLRRQKTLALLLGEEPNEIYDDFEPRDSTEEE